MPAARDQPPGDLPSRTTGSTPTPQPAATGITHAPDTTTDPGVTPGIGEPASASDPPRGIGQPSVARATQRPEPTRSNTPFRSGEARDVEAPTAVTGIDPAAVTSESLKLTWAPASDNVGVIGYRIWLNGFEVASTAETRVSIAWFNDESGSSVVQIRAVDAAGNQSQTSPTVVVTRPTPTPTPSEPSSPVPEASGTPGSDGSATPSQTPSADASPERTQPQ